MATNNSNFVVKNGLDVGQNTTITGSLTAAGLSYPVSDGDFMQAIVTDGSGNLSFQNVDTVESDVTNNTGSLIPKGTPVYQTGTSGQTLTIAPSDASDANTMPAIGVAASDISDGDTGRVIHFGYIKSVDTSAFSEGDQIYVADGGGYQVGRPTGESNVAQFLGIVTKVNATTGSIIVFGGGRSHAVPNLDDGNIFIGDNTNSPVTATLDTSIVPENSNLYFTDTRAVDAIESHPHLTIDGGTLYVDTDNNYIGINDTSPQQALDVTGNIAVSGTTVIDSGAEVVTARLKDSGVTAGSYGSASLVPIITVDSKGRITSASTTSVAGVSNFTFNDSTDVLTIDTADGGSFTADISNLTVGGSLVGPIGDTTVVYSATAPASPSQGQFYFDSLNQKLKVYTGSEWVDAVPAGTGTGGGGETTDAVATVEKYTYSIPSSTNALSGTDDNGNALAYVVDGSQNVELYVNGIKQVEGASNDYVATTGTSVTLTYNLAPGDVVDIMVYELLTQDAFYLKSETYTTAEVNSQISNAVSAYLPLTGGTLTGALNGTSATLSGGLTVDTDTLVVDNTNNRVGIGTTSPVEKLTIYNGNILLDGPTNSDPKIEFHQGTNTGEGGVIVYNDGDEVFTIASRMATYGDINFAIGMNDGDPTDLTYSKMLIKANGNVGIGTTIPASKLHVKDAANPPEILLEHTSGSAQTAKITYNQSGQNKLVISTQYQSATDENLIQFAPADNVAMTIRGGTGNNNGNVGIGTTAPSSKLHIVDGNNHAFIGAMNGNSTMSLKMSDSPVSPVEIQAYSDQLRFRTQPDGSSMKDRMTITSAGNVGIGTNDPTAKLHVSSSAADEPQALFESSGDVSLKLYGGGGEAYLEFANYITATSGWSVGLNDRNYLEFGYGANGSANRTNVMMVEPTNKRLGIGLTVQTGVPLANIHIDQDSNGWDGGIALTTADNGNTYYIHAENNNGGVLVGYSGASSPIRMVPSVGLGITANPSYSLDAGAKTDGIRLPKGTSAERPTANVGVLRYNTALDQPEYVDNSNTWIPLNIPGLTASNPAPSAAYLYDNGFITSGKGMYWIDTPNGGVKQVFCDFDTLDENGDSGWMLVATFATDYDWTNGATTTRDTVSDSFSGNTISANFGDHNTSMFRVTANGTINTSLGSSAAADWYFYLNGGDTWKRWWAPNAGFSYWNGQSYPIYAGDGTIRGRQALIKFTHAHNIKWSYTQTNQIANSLTDASVNTSGYYAGGTTSQYWEALTAPGYFSCRNQQINSSAICGDGTLGILPQGATGNPNAQGQDIMYGNCKVGYDDNTPSAWYGQSATDSFANTQNPGTRNTTSLFWWIK